MFEVTISRWMCFLLQPCSTRKPNASQSSSSGMRWGSPFAAEVEDGRNQWPAEYLAQGVIDRDSSRKRIRRVGDPSSKCGSSAGAELRERLVPRGFRLEVRFERLQRAWQRRPARLAGATAFEPFPGSLRGLDLLGGRVFLLRVAAPRQSAQRGSSPHLPSRRPPRPFSQASRLGDEIEKLVRVGC